METNTDPNAQKPPQNPPPGRTEGDDKGGEGEDKGTVSFSEFKSVKDDMHRFKDEARKNAEELQKLKDKDMRDKDQWKEYASAKEKEANEYKTKYETVTKSITERAKISQVREAALKLGLVDTAIDDLEMMDLKDVVVETTSTGRINVIGAKAAAERIKSIRPHWFSENRTPNVNGNTPTVMKPGGTGSVSYDELSKLEEAAKKTGDYTEYKKKLMEFKHKK
jgi:hypothetical protein